MGGGMGAFKGELRHVQRGKGRAEGVRAGWWSTDRLARSQGACVVVVVWGGQVVAVGEFCVCVLLHGGLQKWGLQ